MKKLILISLLVFNGCANLEEMDSNLSRISGKKLDFALHMLGIPTSSIELTDTNVYFWKESRDGSIGGYNTGYSSDGSVVQIWDNDYISYTSSCSITIYTTKDLNIISASVTDFSSDGCENMDYKLREFLETSPEYLPSIEEEEAHKKLHEEYGVQKPMEEEEMFQLIDNMIQR